MKKIVCFSTTAWNSPPTRKQQVMSRMTDAEILYFDPPVTLIAPFKDRAAAEKAARYKKPGEKVAENITVYALPPVLPFYNKNRTINRINQRRLSSYVKDIIKKRGFEDAVLWIYHPSYADLVKYLPHSSLVYDCVDRHSQYKGFITPEVVDGMEADLARQCDVVFATAAGLYDTLSGYNENCRLIPNGANYELFSGVGAVKGLPPDDIANIASPILGFVGALQECIDYPLLAETARRHPEWSFVFIGAPQPEVELGEIKALPNVHLLGLKPHRALVEYIACFDVCLNVFKSGKLALDVSPLKFYEYLATGKPIVSTAQPLQVQDYGDVVYIAEGADAFEAACAEALSESDTEKTERRMSYGEQCSWDARVTLMREYLALNKILL